MLRLAELILIFVILLDATATISGINRSTDFWANPIGAANAEGNPLIANIIGQGTPVMLLVFFLYLGLVFYLVRRGNPFRFTLFFSVMAMHIMAGATWLFPAWRDRFFILFSSFEALLFVSLLIGVVLSEVLLARQKQYLDAPIWR